MADQSQIEAILDRWHEGFLQGQDLAPEDLCRDCPELCEEVAQRLAVLRHFEHLGRGVVALPGEAAGHFDLSQQTTIHPQPAVPVVLPARPRGILPRPSIPCYHVLDELGWGATGVVYRAVDLRLKRTVALKVIHRADHAAEEQQRRLRIEAEVIARLQHPGIVQVFEVGEYDAPDGRRSYMSMEYCAGGTLAQRMAGTPLTGRTAATLVEALARAVHAAHQAHVLHRDLKPGNVLLPDDPSDLRPAHPREGNARPDATWPPSSPGHDLPPGKVSDFGVAKKLDEAGWTHTGSIIGTPSYMAPEQARGKKEIGPPADVYGLGAILYECLTGRPPFRAATAYETLRQVLENEPVAPRRLQPACPLDLDTICLKCLQKDPAARYPSAAALADDLHRHLVGEPIHARPIGATERAIRWCRRKPSQTALLAVLTLLALILPPAVVWYQGRLHQAEADYAAKVQTEALALQAAEEANKAAQASARARVIEEYHHHLTAAHQRIAEQRPEWPIRARDALLHAAGLEAPDSDPVALRSALAICYSGIDLHEVGRWPTHLSRGGPAFTPDSRTLAVLQHKTVTHLFGTLGLYDVASARSIRRLSVPAASFRHPVRGDLVQDTFTRPVFTPDGRFALAGCRSGKVVRWALHEKGRPLVWQADKGALEKVLLSADGRHLYTFSASEHGDRVVRRWPVDAAAPTAAATSAVAAVSDLDWSPRGTLLARVAGTVVEWDAERLVPLASPSESPCPAGRPLAVLAPAGLLASATRGRVVLWDLERRLPVGELNRDEDDAADVTALAAHPSGVLLASLDEKGILALWNIASRRLLGVRHVPGGTDLAFSPDGRWLAVCARDATIVYEVLQPAEMTWRGVQGMPIRRICLDEDGRTLFTLAARSHPDGNRYEAVVSRVGIAEPRRVLWAGSPARISRSFSLGQLPGSRQLLLLAGDERFVRLDAAGQERQVTSRKPRFTDLSLAIDRTGQVWIGDGDEIVCLEATRNRVVRTWQHPDPFRGVSGYLSLAAGQRHVVAGGREGVVLVLDAAKARQVRTWPTESQPVHAVALSPDETQVAAGLDDGQVRLFRLDRPETTVLAPERHEARVVALAFSPDGKLLASGGRAGKVSLWRYRGETLERLCTLACPQPHAVRQLLFTTDGRQLLVLRERDSAVQVWNLTLFQQRLTTFGLGW